MKEIATKTELIIDDDDGLTSLCIWWKDIGGYLAVVKEGDSDEIYREYVDQKNGFYATTVQYVLDGTELKFTLSDDEYFDDTPKEQKLMFEVPPIICKNADLAKRLKAIFVNL